MTMNNTKLTDTKYLKDFVYYERDLIGSSLEAYGEYQGIEIEFLNGLIKDQVVWDIGANIGVHATGFASVAKEVHSFEPHPMHYKLLEQNTSTLGNVMTYNLAVGDSTDEVTMGEQEENNLGTMRIQEQGDIAVQQVILDDMDLPKPDLIKLDVEGYEINALRGMEKTINEHLPNLNIEAMENNREIIDFFKDKPYNLYWLCVRNFNPNNHKNNQRNIFAVPNGAIFNIFATTGKIDGAQEVLGPNDTWQKLLERVS